MGSTESSIQASEDRAQDSHWNWMRAAGKIITSISAGTVKIGQAGVFTISTTTHCPTHSSVHKVLLADPLLIFTSLTALKRLQNHEPTSKKQLRFREAKQPVRGSAAKPDLLTVHTQHTRCCTLEHVCTCLLYTSDAADDWLVV